MLVENMVTYAIDCGAVREYGDTWSDSGHILGMMLLDRLMTCTGVVARGKPQEVQRVVSLTEIGKNGEEQTGEKKRSSQQRSKVLLLEMLQLKNLLTI